MHLAAVKVGASPFDKIRASGDVIVEPGGMFTRVIKIPVTSTLLEVTAYATVV